VSKPATTPAPKPAERDAPPSPKRASTAASGSVPEQAAGGGKSQEIKEILGVSPEHRKILEMYGPEQIVNELIKIHGKGRMNSICNYIYKQ
jgi:hypothetical protein